MTERKTSLNKAPDKSRIDALTDSGRQQDQPAQETPRRGRPRNRRRKTPVSTSMYIDLLARIEDYVSDNDITLTEFFELAAERQLEHPIQ
ncbi:hypothetical protein [Arthrobacter castelli]|uniref:hypothetical protein n=1 Tax=Arthrobacter castelli TaxID=271431 RepID=UPI0004228354|nr:hypothetical protein [Arthrobacter castelli]